MSALTAGVQYSLSSNQNNGLMPKQRTGKNKTLFFVKLTDSCLKAVEDYLRCCQQVRRSKYLPTFSRYTRRSFHSTIVCSRRLWCPYVLSVVAYAISLALVPRDSFASGHVRTSTRRRSSDFSDQPPRTPTRITCSE